MSRIAQTVFTKQDDIERITQLATALPTGERVRVIERNGQVYCGTVVERPSVQVFEDVDGTEGMNAVLRLDDPAAPPWRAELWLSDIEKVEPLSD